MATMASTSKSPYAIEDKLSVVLIPLSIGGKKEGLITMWQEQS